MFKKTLAALAVAGAFVGTAAAADVTLYGVVDYGFNYQHVDADAQGVDASDKFQMMSGQNSGSRFGLKGTEDLGNGLTVGFVLENGFDADTGALSKYSDERNRIFGREAQVYLQGSFGKLSFGRVGQLASANGTYSLLGAASPFSGGWQDSVGQKYLMANGFDRFDNTITYVTPDFAGFKVHAQYSFDTDGNSKAEKGMPTKVEGKSTATRYYALGATYNAQNLYLVGIVDSMNWGAYKYDTSKVDDQLTVTLGGAYDLQVAKLYAEFQYFDNAQAVGAKSAQLDGSIASGYKFSTNGAEGYGVILGVGVPAFGGTAKAQLGYMDAEDTKVSDWTVSRWNVSVGYDYALSKRTSVYTAAAYTRDDVSDSFKGKLGTNPSTVEVMAGLIHKF